MKKHHPGHGHKRAKQAGQSNAHGSNLELPHASQAMHVKPAKDTMAHNVGGSGAHQMVDSKSMGHEDLIESSGKGLKKVKEKY